MTIIITFNDSNHFQILFFQKNLKYCINKLPIIKNIPTVSNKRFMILHFFDH